MSTTDSSQSHRARLEQSRVFGLSSFQRPLNFHTNVWAGGQLLGTYNAVTDSNGRADGALHFYLNDWLGTRRAQTDYAGDLEQTCASLPYGDATCPAPTEHLFTGKERDTESGNDYFEARYYGSNMGRFLSPDPVGGHLEDPQSLNKYADALNNPLTNTDSTGLDSYLQAHIQTTTHQLASSRP